jgi:hypothetical protein
MEPMPQAPPAQGAPAPEAGGGPGNASQLVVDIQEKMASLMDLVGQKFPDEAQKLQGIMSAYEGFIEGLGQAPGAQAPKEMGGPKGAVPMETGGMPAKQVL